MVTVGDLLEHKGSTVWTIEPDKTVLDALKHMADKEIGALVVVGEGRRVVGMVSERDYARKIVLRGKKSKDTSVGDIMTTEVCYVTPERTAEECMAIMTNKTIRHLPVLDNGELVGLVSIGDVVRSVISEQEFIIGQLESYITGK
jgi:CBS domain-containing protein